MKPEYAINFIQALIREDFSRPGVEDSVLFDEGDEQLVLRLEWHRDGKDMAVERRLPLRDLRLAMLPHLKMRRMVLRAVEEYDNSHRPTPPTTCEEDE